MTALFPIVFCVLAAYLMGSIPTGLWLGRALRGIDIREHGSKNIGATNTLRVLGTKLGVCALLGDMAKGALPVLAAGWLIHRGYAAWTHLPLACGLCAILGHFFPLYLRFKGGKGVATSTGVFLALIPPATLSAAGVFFAVVLSTQMVSAGSIAAAITLGGMVFVVETTWPVRVMTLLIATLVVVKHRTNISRIVKGEESRVWDPAKHIEPAPFPGAWHKPTVTDWVTLLLPALFALALYIQCLPTAITGEDAGELAAAAYTLGIPHPPGYPLWCIVAHLFTWIPMGSAAWRVSLCSAVFAAAAVYVAGMILVMLTRNRLAAVCTALAAAFSFEFWEQAVIPEVYSLNAFLFLLCLLLAFTWHMGLQRGAPRPGLLYALALVYGLSLGNHHTMLLAGPWLALYVFLADSRHGARRWGRYLVCVAMALAAAVLIHAYLPLRSLANPAMDWGDPETLGRWWRHVSREQFAFMFTQYPRGMGRFVEQAAMMAGLAFEQYPPWVYGAAGLGLGVLARRRSGLLLWSGGLALTIVLAFVLVQNPELTSEWRWVMSVFPIPAYLLLGLPIAAGLDWLWRLHRARWYRALAVLFALACGLGGIVPGGIYHVRAGDTLVEDYARNILEALPPGAVYFPETDQGGFPVLYLQIVEGMRPDVAVGRRYGYVEMGLFQGLPPDRLAELGMFPPRRHEPELFSWLLAQDDRPVFFEKRPPIDARVVQHGLLYQALRPGEKPAALPGWDEYTWRGPGLAAKEALGEYSEHALLFQIHLRQAESAFAAGNEDEAFQLVDRALFAYSMWGLQLDAAHYNNAGVVCARQGAYETAAVYFTQALQRKPGDARIRANLERAEARTPSHEM